MSLGTKPRKPSTRLVLILALALLLLPLLGMAVAARLAWPFGCSDPREDCDASDSYSGDHTLPQVLQRFSIQAPCGTTGLRYAYADAWNDSDEILALHATVTPDCLRAFVARIAPGTDLDAAPLLRPDAGTAFPSRLSRGSFPNGPLVLPAPGHSYRIVTGTTDGMPVSLSIDTDTPSPTIEARFEHAGLGPWPD